MTREEMIMLAFLLLVLGLALYLALRLLRASRPLLRDVFSRDLGVLRRRLLIGLADIGCTFFAAYFFFSGEMMVPLVQSAIALGCLVVFATGMALWLLAGLQLFAILFTKPKQPPAEPPPQSSP